MINVILLAPPASGKGTQANLLKEKVNLVHLSTGDLLRNAVKKNDEFGKKLNEIMSSGSLVSDDIVMELLNKNILENKDGNGFIFDGFPRTVNQAEKLDNLLSGLDMKLNYVFLLDVDYDILVKRITGRLTCSNCGKIYNIYNEDMSPSVENICDVCSSNLTKRADDNEESFKIRYQEYLDKTYPLIEYYKNKGNLIEIDSSGNIDDIFKEILSFIERDV